MESVPRSLQATHTLQEPNARFSGVDHSGKGTCKRRVHANRQEEEFSQREIYMYIDLWCSIRHRTIVDSHLLGDSVDGRPMIMTDSTGQDFSPYKMCILIVDRLLVISG